MNQMSVFLRSMKDLFFPPVCVSCRTCVVDSQKSSVELLCERCCSELRDNSSVRADRCQCCGFPITVLKHGETQISFGCLECQRWGFQFARTVCLGSYEGRLQQLVLRAKTGAGAPIAYALGQALGHVLNPTCIEIIVPVPVHWRRRVKKPQNTVEVIANGLHSTVRGRVILKPEILRASRMTLKQGTLSPQKRCANVRDAFEVSQPEMVKGKKVLVVDDVMTTGATVHEIGNLLLKAQAQSVSVAVICRAGD
ncbi:MAG: hypothetical protein CMJ82_07275 [Planctomycetaceae bacterium]|nr:hypothetical protein [Planctomycetaceae bacterium]